MKVSKEVYTRDFRNEIPKEAYLQACQWVAKNVLSKNSKVEVNNVTWNIFRVDGNDLPTFRLTLYITYDEDEVSERTCSICKEMHTSFFVNENYNCDRCNKESYRRKLKQKLDIGSECLKEKVMGAVNSFN